MVELWTRLLHSYLWWHWPPHVVHHRSAEPSPVAVAAALLVMVLLVTAVSCWSRVLEGAGLLGWDLQCCQP
jgi:sterol desaturase/sphingolipid hydroxylase (fatty acid hydroxylase superfamily)